MRIYADHAATTPVSDEAWAAMQPFLREHFGNASEPHWAGREARRGLEAARAQAADALGVAAADIVFTGGASEADNIAVLGRATRGPGRIVTTPLEHPAVSGAVEELERQGCEVVTLPVDADGRVPVSAFEAAVQPGDLLCSLIWASNLTGVIQPVAEAAAICAERGVPLHLDAVQACPALEVDIGSLPGEITAAVAGHKLGGPKGAGLLCGRGLATLQPVLFGGGQERALRPGTESVAQAAGLAAALAAARADHGRYRRYRAVRDAYEAALVADVPGVTIVGERAERTPGHSLALIEGLNGHALVSLLDEQGVAAAAGPACASAESSASPALTAMGVTTDQARGALRLSFGALSEDGHGVLAAGAVVRCARAAAARKRGRLMLRQDDFELAGRVPEPDGEGFAGGSACGDRVRITLALGAGRDDRRRALRCSSLRACDRRGGLGLPPQPGARDSWTPPARRSPTAPRSSGSPATPVSAPRWRSTPCTRPSATPPSGRSRSRLHGGRVAVAMSGGVDSAVALLRERAGSGDVVGLTLRLWIDEQAPDAERACCSPAAVLRARESCHALGLPHVTLDGREAFRRAVVEPFVAGYARGETPNPCTTCNGSYRLAALVGVAQRLGARHVATGHYARLVERDGRTLVGRGADAAKDQSYMLARVPPEVLERLRLPLGNATKAAVRAEAAAAGLAAATARESQDVCFLGGGALDDFLAREGVQLDAGSIRDEAGHELGRHTGTAAYTPGQRRGLGVAAPTKLYVLRADAARNELVVGPRSSLACSEVWLSEARSEDGVTRVHAKLRGRSPTVSASVEPVPGGLRLRLDEPVYGVAAGQTAALYDEYGCVVGSGVIALAESLS